MSNTVSENLLGASITGAVLADAASVTALEADLETAENRDFSDLQAGYKVAAREYLVTQGISFTNETWDLVFGTIHLNTKHLTTRFLGNEVEKLGAKLGIDFVKDRLATLQTVTAENYWNADTLVELEAKSGAIEILQLHFESFMLALDEPLALPDSRILEAVRAPVPSQEVTGALRTEFRFEINLGGEATGRYVWNFEAPSGFVSL